MLPVDGLSLFFHSLMFFPLFPSFDQLVMEGDIQSIVGFREDIIEGDIQIAE